MDRLKARGVWGKDSLPYERPDRNVAVRMCEAQGLSVRFFDTQWKVGMGGRPFLDPHNPEDSKKIEHLLGTQEGRLVVDCDGLVVTGSGGEGSHALLPMPRSIPATGLLSVVPLVTVDQSGSRTRVRHLHPALRSELTNRIGMYEAAQDPRVRQLMLNSGEDFSNYAGGGRYSSYENQGDLREPAVAEAGSKRKMNRKRSSKRRNRNRMFTA